MSDTALAALLGLSTALCGGLGTFTGQRLTGRLGWLRAVWLAQAIGLPLVTAAALLLHGPPPADPAVLHALGLGLVNVFSVVALYRAFAAGALSIVAPVASSYAAVTLVLASLAGDTPAPPLALGLVAVIAGVAVVAAAHGSAGADEPRPRAAGLVWAVLSSMSLGAVFFWLEPVSAALGPVWPVALMRASGAAALGLLRLLRPPPAPHGRVPFGLLAACVLLDTGGLLLYARGVGLGGAALVAVLASLSSVIAVALAHRRLHEQLSAGQWIGVVLVLAGTVWISARLHLA